MRAVFSDLDGSLHDRELGIHPQDYAALQALAEQQVLRVVVTGRSLYAACRVLPPDFPIDYLIFSSGVGVVDWKQQALLDSITLESPEIVTILDCLSERQLDFMLHAPVPENHHFWYQRGTQPNPDFEARLALYAAFAEPLTTNPLPQAASACIAIVKATDTVNAYQELQTALPQLSIIRATSPLDRCSGWLEIFPASVSKSQAAERLCQALGITSHMAFGNDYNDQDLLHWADRAFVVKDAPAELLHCFEWAETPEQAGFSQALQQWLTAPDKS